MKKKVLILGLLLIFITGCKTKTYVVKIVDEGEELASITVNKGENISDITLPEKEGYLFLNFLKDGLEYDVNKPVKSDITLEVVWTEEPDLPNNHIVVFNFGDYTKKLTVKDGEKATEPKDEPKKEKHKFLGWYDGDTLYDFNNPITKDIVLTAKFEKNRITIHYDLNGGTGSTIEVEIEKGTIPQKPKNPSKFGYTFTSWLIGNNVYNFNTKLYEDTTIVANYTPNIYYKVSFNTDGGNEIASKMLVAGEKLTELPAPVKEGYTFKYWSYQDKEFDLSMNIDKDIILLAIYEEVEEEE